MLSARVCDPLGPLRARAIGPAFTVALGLLLGSGLFSGWASWITGAALFAAASLASTWSARRLRAVRPVKVHLGRGSLDLKGAGALSQRILARDIVAARVARSRHGAAIALVRHRGRRRPLLLELRSDEELRSVRQALRIGPAGFGVMAWPGEPGGWLHAALVSVEATWFVLFAVGITCSELVGPLGAFVGAGPLTLALLLAWEAFGPGAVLRLVMTDDGIVSTDAAGRVVRVAYRDMVGVNVQPQGSLLVGTARETIVLQTADWIDDERDFVVASLEAAIERARREGPPESDVPPALAFLEPKGETSRHWLERVDATANALASSDAYRRPHVPAADLWTALESPDAPATVRAAAARVLARIAPEEASWRVADVLASERDARTRELIHLALEEDIEHAAANLDELAS